MPAPESLRPVIRGGLVPGRHQPRTTSLLIGFASRRERSVAVDCHQTVSVGHPSSSGACGRRWGPAPGMALRPVTAAGLEVGVMEDVSFVLGPVLVPPLAPRGFALGGVGPSGRRDGADFRSAEREFGLVHFLSERVFCASAVGVCAAFCHRSRGARLPPGLHRPVMRRLPLQLVG
ncbi:hypothetical protein Mapa_010701 [Marchantia paleacea]|nr:hypothetical protein Mapa_010701 [Marchantia paleacea]